MEELSLIDVSAEDDFLFDLASPPQLPDPQPRAVSGERAVSRSHAFHFDGDSGVGWYLRSDTTGCNIL